MTFGDRLASYATKVNIRLVKIAEFEPDTKAAKQLYSFEESELIYMRLIFLIPLTTSFVAGYFLQKSADEMAYLTGTVTIVSLILTLVLAPWQIQLLILAFVIISTRKLLQRNEYQIQPENQEEKLEESGVGNEHNTAQVNEGEVTGKYRGLPWKSNSNQPPAPQQAKFNLKYRGADIKR